MAGFTQVITTLVNFFKKLPRTIKNVGDALKDFSASSFWYGPSRTATSMWDGTTKIADGTVQILFMIGKYFVITIIFLWNLPFCIIPHFILLIFYLAYYVFLISPIIIIKYTTGLDLMPNLRFLFSILRQGNSIVFDRTGISLMDFPSEINGKCYTYFGKPLTIGMIYDDLNVFTRVGDELDYTFNVHIPNLMRLPTNLMRSARNKFRDIVGG